ncbi:MAG TPA: AMP-binding protein, partial [Myxococcota bacterium]|nr:AMP-binding protein [Myxococcota bacterium]
MELAEALERWRREQDAFRWSVPDPFNFGRDVVDRFADDPSRRALLWRDAEGRERRLGFGDVRAGSNRAAHLFTSFGVRAGEPVLVMLPRVPEWQLVIVGALKAGALVIPSATTLRPKDIVYRVGHSGAVAIITTRAQASTVDAVRRELTSVRSWLALAEEGEQGGPPVGWEDLGSALALQPASDPPAIPTCASDPALVYYTSGT